MKFMYEIYTWNKDKIRHGQNTIQNDTMHNFTLPYVQYKAT